MDLESREVVFSDILEIKLADGTRVRGCFALRHRTRQVPGIAFDYHMRAELVMDAIQTMSFEVPDPIWHSDQGNQYGVAQTRELLLQKGFVLSMSRAGLRPIMATLRDLSASSSSLWQIAALTTPWEPSCVRLKLGLTFTIRSDLTRV